MSFGAHIDRLDKATRKHLGGVDVLYQPPVGDAVTVRGMFDENFVPMAPGDSRVEQSGPSVHLTLAELPGNPLADKATVTISNIIYKVRARERDGAPGGGVVLRLAKIGVVP